MEWQQRLVRVMVVVALLDTCMGTDDEVMKTSSENDPGSKVGNSPSLHLSPCAGDSIPSLRDCSEIQDKCPDRPSGVYWVHPDEYSTAFTVFCDFDSDGGDGLSPFAIRIMYPSEGTFPPTLNSIGVFQRREDGSVNFERGWMDYKEGFGFLSSEFWLGNDKIAYLTYQKEYEMRIELGNKLGTRYYAKYTFFRIAGERDLYRITLGSYSGNAAFDALDFHRNCANNLKCAFTTLDADHDDYADGNCAHTHNGAWWFDYCDNSNLNALYGVDSNASPGGMEWDNLPGGNFGLTFSEMKIRPK